jgi:hypothetical protein
MDTKQFRKIIQEELEPIKKVQEEQSEKLDAITLELHDVHLLANATLKE